MDNVNFTSVLIFLLFNFVTASSASKDYLPRAKNVTWSSHNFKTILRWGPKPFNYSHTVEFSKVRSDKQRNPHCIRTLETTCDLTNELMDLRSSYTADIISEPLPGTITDLIELPFTQSKKFCPYTDTIIGKPDFQIKLNENKTVVIYIRDQLTALYRDGRLLSVRDIFEGDLKYKIMYSRAQSTGKTEKIVDQNEVELKELDQGEGYCFSVAAYITSRKGPRKMGRWSRRKCSQAENKDLIAEYGLWTVGGGALLLVAVMVTLIVAVICCKRKCGRNAESGKPTISQV